MGDQLNTLESLRGLHAPANISWWPLAPGWWFLIILFVVLFAIVIYRLKSKPKPYQITDYKASAIDELNIIEQTLVDTNNDQQFITTLSLLMKRYTHIYYPEAASLTGLAWLKFLDEGLGEGFGKRQFQNYHEQLCVAPYAATPVQHKDELIALVKTWLNQLPLNNQPQKNNQGSV